MYDNIGSKIKGLAKTVFIVEAIAAVIAGIALMSGGYDEVVIGGIAIIILGPFVAWVSSWMLYGFGELIDKTCDIARNTSNGESKSETQAKVHNKRIGKLEKLLSQGLITEEEYQQASTKEQ